MSLTEVIENLEQFTVVKCGMHHEKVLLDKDETPVKNVIGDDVSFARMQLCEGRRQRLGCAHTSANDRFNRLLESVEHVAEIPRLREEFNNLILKVYQLDHIVGNLEHDKATGKIVDDQLEDCKRQHASLMDQLNETKLSIIAQLTTQQ